MDGWTREKTKDGLSIIQRHGSGGHIVAIQVGPQVWKFDAWMPGLGGFARSLGSYDTADEARAAVEENANQESPNTEQERPLRKT